MATRSIVSLPRFAAALFCLASLLIVAGCWSASNQQEVVVYTALEFARPIFADFEKQTGVKVLPKWDTEATKTTGLAQAILAEAKRPRCDVFWNNEILNTLRMEEKGLLAVYRPRTAGDYPALDQSADGLWYGFAARARILMVNTKLVADDERPTSIHALTDPKWRGKIGIAKPLFGTTATQAACLFTVLGDEPAKKYFTDLKANGVQVLSGNKQVAMAVAAGQIAFGLTDTDDALEEQENGAPVVIVYPDQGAKGIGTLFIPNTLAIMKNCPHPAEARRLVDFLLTPQVEEQLAAGPGAQIPLNKNVKVKLRVETPHTVKAMQVDFHEAARRWDEVATFIRDEFAGAN